MIRAENIHYKNLETAGSLISHIRNTAVFYNNSFSSIISYLSETEEFAKSDYLELFISYINSGTAPPDAWRNAVKNSKMNYTSAEKDALMKFGTDMCSCSRERIDACGKEALDRFDEFKRKANEKREKKTKTTAVMTISAGMITALMFI